MSILNRLDSFLCAENAAVRAPFIRAPLGPRAQEFLDQNNALNAVPRLGLDLIGEFRLSQSFSEPIDTILDLLSDTKEAMSRAGDFPANKAVGEVRIDFVKLDEGTDVGVYIGFPDKGTECYSYILRMQCGGKVNSSVDSSRRLTVWRYGESRQLRRERYDKKVASEHATSSELRKDRAFLIDKTVYKDALLSSTLGSFTKKSSIKKANEERQWYDAVHRLISSTLSGAPCFGVESLANSEVGYY